MEKKINETVAVVGLGYVGLPLAVALGRITKTIGFDLSEKKVSEYRDGFDATNEVSREEMAAAKNIQYTTDASFLSEAKYIVVAVPTPIDEANHPDLSPLKSASEIVGKNMSGGAIVIFESTVFPGATEEVCVPILENESGMKWGEDFYVGYSPERINPGDKEHRLENIVKVVSGDTEKTLDEIAQLYESVVQAGVHRASSIKVAEAAKVIENTQRDLNIALMNELAMIFDRLDIDTLEVLEAAGTKWNFLPFRPGLVGGHCIGVDPYYLTYKSEMLGHHPKVILAGRETNDGVGKYIAEQTIKKMILNGLQVRDSKVAVLGLTFKENCSDLRNSRVVDVITELAAYGIKPLIHDPMADADEALHEYGIELVGMEAIEDSDVLVITVAHDDYKESINEIVSYVQRRDGVLVDVKGIVPTEIRRSFDGRYWRL